MDKHPVRRIALTVGGLIAVGLVALLAGFSVAFHRSPVSVLMGQFTTPPQELFHKDHILVLAEGLDYDYNSKDEEYSSASRSDVIKAINLEFTTQNAYIVDVPRDMDAVLPDGRETKINEAQAEGGVHEAEGVIASWLGVPGFDRYIILRVNTTKDLINALGGVDIDPMNSDAIMHLGPNGPIDYDDSWGHLHIHFKPGMQHLSGDQAVAYARFRHDWCSDPCRIKRQDQVIKAVVAKLRNDKFNTLMHLHDLIGVFQRDVQTNLSQAELESIAMTFAGMPKDALHTAQVPYVGDKIAADGGDVIIPDQSKKTQLVENMLLNPPVPTPTPDAGTVAAIDPRSVHVDVENGTGVPGAAGRVAALLKTQGFVIGSIGDASSSVDTTQLLEHSKILYSALRVRQALGKAAAGAQVIADTQASPTVGPSPGASDVTVIVGSDLAAAVSQQASRLP